MQGKDLDKKQQRWVAVGLLIVVLVLLVSLVLVPVFFKVYEYRESIENLQFRLDRYNKKIAGKQNLIQHIAKTRENLRQAGYFGLYKTAALATAELQEQVKLAVTSSGGQLTSTQALPPKDLYGLNSASRFELKQIRGKARYGCAPQIFFFEPQKKWYLIFCC